MSDSIVKVEGLGKKYIISHEGARGSYTALRDVISNKAKSLIKRSNGVSSSNEEFWALKDVSFEIKKGETVGIIGRNGAGKSTLLKILSRITEPTTGRIEINGRVASLLEVGTGFHPELTGRENIFLNGAILGMSRLEIRKKFDEIVDFSGVEKFLDTPVKRYSSGMYVRLAFAVAAHLDPEILVVDEVLAVGDAEFQKKCLGKMKDVSISEGRTILFVSHDMSAISTLTKKIIVLQKGGVGFIGNVDKGIEYYLQNSQTNDLNYEINPDLSKPNIFKVEINTSGSGNVHTFGQPLFININVYIPQGREGMALSIQVFNHLNVPVIYNWIMDNEKSICRTSGVHRFSIEYPNLKLYQGFYFLRVHLAETNNTREKFSEIDCCHFEVVMVGKRAPEWGWQSNVCQYFEEAKWLIDNEQLKMQSAEDI